MTILMICPQFRPIVGGYERAAERLAKALAERGHRIEVWTERREKGWLATEVDGLVTVRRHWSLVRPGVHSASTLCSFGAAFIREGRKFDLFHVHQVGTVSAAAIVMGKLLGKPVVIKTVSSGPANLARLLRRGRLAQLLLRIHRSADAVAVSSLTTRNDALEIGIPEDRVFLVGNGVDPALFRPLAASEKAIAKRQVGVRAKLLVVFVGRLSDEKQPLLLLDAWRRLAPSSVGAELVFVGDGPQTPILREKVNRLSLDSSVRCTGATDNVLPWYQAADLFVLPSMVEGFSNSLLEAMSAALPVVSTRVSGSIDVFRMADVGELVDVGDAAGISGAIRKMLSDTERRQMCGDNARRLVLSEFSMERVADRALEMYRTLLEGRRHV